MATYSRYASDPAMLSDIAYFIRVLPVRLQAMRSAAATSDTKRVQHLAHQLKGAGAMYGFPSVSSAAEAVESAGRLGDAEACRRAVDALEAIINDCRAGTDGADGGAP